MVKKTTSKNKKKKKRKKRGDSENEYGNSDSIEFDDIDPAIFGIKDKRQKRLEEELEYIKEQ